MLLAANSGLYDALVAAHVVCAVVGFGSVALSGVYGALARNPESSDETRRFFESPSRAGWLIVAVPFLGAAALLAGGREDAFGDLWVVAGWGTWLAASVILLSVIRPAEAAIRVGHGGSEVPRRLMWAGVACDLLFAVALAFMVTQPA